MSQTTTTATTATKIKNENNLMLTKQEKLLTTESIVI